MALVWLPPDLPPEALGPLPPVLELGVLPEPGAVGPGAGEVEVVVLSPGQRASLVEQLPRLGELRVVQTLNAGIDWVPALPPGVLLCNAGGVHDGPVADWTVGVILATGKRLPHLFEQQRSQTWDASANLAFGAGPPADDLAEQTVLIVGYGSIGRALQNRLRPFGCRVLRVARRPREEPDGPVGGVDELPSLVPEADVVVLLAPGTDQTHHLVDAGFLARMRPGALLVNAARGTLVDTGALLTALEAGRVRAALDATDPEPLPDGHPLWSAPGVIVTPHVAGSSTHWLGRAYRLVGDQLRRYAAGEPLHHQRLDGY